MPQPVQPASARKRHSLQVPQPLRCAASQLQQRSSECRKKGNHPQHARTRLRPGLQQRCQLLRHLRHAALVDRLCRRVLAALAQVLQVEHQARHLAHVAATAAGGAAAAKGPRCSAAPVGAVLRQWHHLDRAHHVSRRLCLQACSSRGWWTCG